MIFKHGWWRHTDDLSDVLHERPDNRNDARIGFHHRLENDREQTLRDNKLTLYFRNMGPTINPSSMLFLTTSMRKPMLLRPRCRILLVSPETNAI